MMDVRNRARPMGQAALLQCAVVLAFLPISYGFFGTKSSPVHLGGGFMINNLDAFGMTVGALVLSVIR